MNTNQINKVFLYHASAGVTLNASSGSIASVYGAAINADIEKGSIYGMAKFNNQWKGVRVEKSTK